MNECVFVYECVWGVCVYVYVYVVCVSGYKLRLNHYEINKRKSTKST